MDLSVARIRQHVLLITQMHPHATKPPMQSFFCVCLIAPRLGWHWTKLMQSFFCVRFIAPRLGWHGTKLMPSFFLCLPHCPKAGLAWNKTPPCKVFSVFASLPQGWAGIEQNSCQVFSYVCLIAPRLGWHGTKLHIQLFICSSHCPKARKTRTH